MTTWRAGRRLRWLCGLAFFFLVTLFITAAPAAREYRTVEFESLRVTIDSDWANRSAPGYLPVRFEITNMGDARVIEIIGQGSRSYRGLASRGGGGTMYVRQSVRLARGDRVRLTLPIPVYADLENIRFEIREDGRRLEGFTYHGFQSRVAPRDASVLIVANSQSAFGTIAARLPRSSSGRGSAPIAVGGRGVTVVTSPSGTITLSTPATSGRPSAGDFVLEPARLPGNWLGFTSLRAVAIGPTEWDQLNEGQKSALLTWTASGGDLIFADGDLGVLLPGVQSEAVAGPPARVVGRHFFGRIHVMTSASLATAGLGDVLAALDARTHDAYWALPVNTAADWGAIEGRGFRLRIPGIDGVPARVYLGILLLFSLLIGPVNYWLLWRKRRHVLLVLTAPLISVAFIVLLGAYAVAGEGFGVQGRVVTFTMLDQSSKQAATRATASLYAAGMTPAAGLRFGRDVAVFPIGPDGAGARDRLHLDLTEDQQFASGVVQARSPANFEQVTFRPARERLTFSQEQGVLSVTNGLEAPVAALLYRDGDTVYRADGPVPSGGKQTLSRLAAADAGAVLPGQVATPAKFLNLFSDPPRGAYLAVLARSPFWEPGVSGLTEVGSFHLVLGWPDGRR